MGSGFSMHILFPQLHLICVFFHASCLTIPSLNFSTLPLLTLRLLNLLKSCLSGQHFSHPSSLAQSQSSFDYTSTA